jgi:hypothetical protein
MKKELEVTNGKRRIKADYKKPSFKKDLPKTPVVEKSEIQFRKEQK